MGAGFQLSFAPLMPETLPPHPVLGGYYGEAANRERFVRNIFDETAVWYDDIIAMLSFGSGNRYRRQALERSGLRGGMRLLDLATGTGVVARAARATTPDIVGADASFGMLLAGRPRTNIPLVQSKGEVLPLADATFDMVSVGYALRHFADLRALFAEIHRVLRPGGRVVILEISTPLSRGGYVLMRFHLNRVVPLLARIRTGSAKAKQLMHYYWDTIAACVPPETILAALADAGFSDVRRHVELGTFSEYTGIRMKDEG
jgi:demethylmenaquinone methyltransferase / 2-methoxy-6-polyprenyl-1,4-benzoquinol methylase